MGSKPISWKNHAQFELAVDILTIGLCSTQAGHVESLHKAVQAYDSIHITSSSNEIFRMLTFLLIPFIAINYE